MWIPLYVKQYAYQLCHGQVKSTIMSDAVTFKGFKNSVVIFSNFLRTFYMLKYLCCTNQLTGFYMRAALALNGLRKILLLSRQNKLFWSFLCCGSMLCTLFNLKILRSKIVLYLRIIFILYVSIIICIDFVFMVDENILELRRDVVKTPVDI